jgi:hypothetical protein
MSITCAVTSSSFAHDDVSSLVMDDHTDADEGALRLRHDFEDMMLSLGRSFVVFVRDLRV